VNLVDVALTVNGSTHQLRITPDRILLDALRDELGLYGAREGCGIGTCGSCTVLINGSPISSCLTLAFQADGKEILTIEGLEGPDGALDSIQQAFVENNAFQCSYCTPGFILTTRSLLDENPNPDEQTIKEYLAGNLCRCGSYPNIVEAILRLAKPGEP
jgi:aerobic carbon-monoxide dehydrogenase small subunit